MVRITAGSPLLRRSAYFAVILATLSCSDSSFTPLEPLTSLPADLAAVTFTATGQPTTPYVMLELRNPTGYSGFVAVNGSGQPVWMFRTQGTASGSTRRANGDFVFLDGDRGLVEVSPAGKVVAELAQQAAPGRRIHHDVTATPNNTLLFLGEDWQQWNGALLKGEALWEWNPETGTTVKRWSSFTHLDPNIDWGARSIRDDWLHANAVSYGPRGNVLVSFHFLDQVISLSPGFSKIQWRLGGVRNTIPLADPFSGQHNAQEIKTDRILLFDNGYDRTDNPYSRAVEYSLSGSTATKVWQWRPPVDNWARIISGVRRLPNGNSLITFGDSKEFIHGATGSLEVYEVTAGGSIVWHLVIGGAMQSMYRATPIDKL